MHSPKEEAEREKKKKCFFIKRFKDALLLAYFTPNLRLFSEHWGRTLQDLKMKLTLYFTEKKGFLGTIALTGKQQ